MLSHSWRMILMKCFRLVKVLKQILWNWLKDMQHGWELTAFWWTVIDDSWTDILKTTRTSGQSKAEKMMVFGDEWLPYVAVSIEASGLHPRHRIPNMWRRLEYLIYLVWRDIDSFRWCCLRSVTVFYTGWFRRAYQPLSGYLFNTDYNCIHQ